MSRDIRSFFSSVPKKNATTGAPKVEPQKKKARRLVDSDDDDVIECTPEKSRAKPILSKKIEIVSSDSEDEPPKKAKKISPKSEVSNLKPVNIDDIFSSKPIKQSQVKTLPKGEAVKIEERKQPTKSSKKKKTKNGDEAFETTLMELDDDLLTENLDILDKTADDALKIDIETSTDKLKKHESKTGKHVHKVDDIEEVDYPKKHQNKTDPVDRDEEKINSLKSKKKKGKPDSEEAFQETFKQSDAESKESKRVNKKPVISVEDGKQSSSKENSPNKSKEEKKAKRQRSPSTGVTPKKAKLDNTDSGIDPDQEAFEKKRYSAMLYQKYINRPGPKMHGQKQYPKGSPTCLKNLTFLRTGVLDSLDGEEFQNLVTEHGGRVVHGVSKKVNFIVVGEDAGPSKLSKASDLKIPQMNEDEFLDMILVKSGKKPKYCQDSGVFSSEDPLETETQEKEKFEKEKKKDKGRHNAVDEEINKKREKQTNSPKKGTDKHSASPAKKVSQKSPEKKQSENSESSKTSKQPANETATESEKQTRNETKSSQSPADNTLAWTEKYKPTDIGSIIGQQGSSSHMNSLRVWLSNWYRNQLPEVRKKIPRPSPYERNPNGAYFKAALLSGPPGVGKTTTATLVCKDLGFDIVEFNASDTRSKKLLQEQVSQLLSTSTIAGFAAGKSKTDKKRVLLMDEVDGMAGNEDRGGIQELIKLIQTTNIPIICMCNDRNLQKMRSFVTHCFELKFVKPKMEQIRGAMMSICFKEGLKITPNQLSEVIAGTDCDIRQTLNHLTMWAASNKDLTLEQVKSKAEASKKDRILGPWEVVRKVFTESEQKQMTLSDKLRLFFYDYSMGPLFIQENYLNVKLQCSPLEKLKRAALAADAISKGDLIDAKIRSSNNWSLLESQAMYSSVLPGYYMSGTVGPINFPGWLGKNSNANKKKRMASELHVHARMSISGSLLAMKLDYLSPLMNAIVTPLVRHGVDGIEQSLEVMNDYNLLREDLTNLIELCHWKGTTNPFNSLQPKIKAAFTRAYNKSSRQLPFAPEAGFKKKQRAAGNLDSEEETVESDEEKDDADDVTGDALIKVRTKKKEESAKAGTSKSKETSKGKGKNKKTK